MFRKWTFAGLGALTGLAWLHAAPLAAAGADKPTFTRDVAPIFQSKCEACHRPGSIAPMSLRTFREARPWASAIKAKVESRQMPPWHIDKSIGVQEFKNDRSLSEDQISTIVKWVEQGAAQGDPVDMPALREWSDKQTWNYAARFGQTEPDLIIRSTPWTQKAGANDTWWKPVVETGIAEPRWVRAIEVRPATVRGRQITHHANVDLDQVDADAQASGTTLGRFMEWAVGKEGELMNPNSGKLLLPGSRIAWDIHYSQSREDITDHVEMGLYFYPTGSEPKYRQTLLAISVGRNGIDIPPNTVKASDGFFVLKRSARIESFQPHMHLRGRAMSMEAILPSGQRHVLSHVPNFTFNWHNSYVYGDEAAPLLPKGTAIKVTAWHDNTAANKANPDPDVWVGYGDRTVDEMGHAWVSLTYLSDEDYLDEVEKRRARLAARAAQP